MAFWDNKGDVANPEVKPGQPATPESKPAEKTQAELIADALSPLTAQFQAITDRLNKIEESTRKPEPAQPSTATELPSVFVDEDAAFNQRMTPLALRTLELEARMVTNDIKGEFAAAGFGDLWKKYEKDIQAQLDASPVVDVNGKPLRGNPDYIRNVADMILGRAARQSGVRFDGQKQTFFLESAGGSVDASTTASQTHGLTEAQLKVFRRMGIDPAAGKSTVDKLQFIN